MTVRGVILDGELWSGGGSGSEHAGDPVHLFVELEEGTLSVRRSYGERSTILSLELDDVEAALAALKAEVRRKPPKRIVDDDVDAGPS